MSWYGFAPYKSMGAMKAECEAFIKKFRKKHPNIQPIVIEGTKIAKTWWGKAWNNNLEKYADYEYRLSRGRSYVRNGFVIDLQIDVGKVFAKVKGSSLYDVKIVIDPIPDSKRQWLNQKCANKIENISALVEGRFPEEMSSLFMDKKTGLFPSPREIHFDCNCPDSARMCKHVAAVLYGIGRRFDDDPLLFFKLRRVNINELIRRSIDEKMGKLLSKSNKKSDRIIEDTKIEKLFGLLS